MAERRGSLRISIAEALRSDIRDGRHGPGGRLPSEAQLATRFGVNRHTVREALAQLGREGLVASRRGSGSFVLGRPTDYPIGRRVRFGRNLLAAGHQPSRAETVVVTRAADGAEAEALALGTGDPVHAYEGVSLADGQPLALFLSVFPADRLPHLPAFLREEGSVTAALARAGVDDYERASTRLNAVEATPVQAARLRLPDRAPLLRTRSVSVDARGILVELGTTWFAGERVTLTLDGHG